MGVVVTGSSGFVGRHVVALLSAHGHQVTGLDRRPDAGQGAAARAGSYRHLLADLAEAGPEARAALAAADAVVHLAGCPGVRDSSADVARRRHRDNVGALRETLAAVPDGVPVVVASSSSVYGGSRRGRPSAESDALAPRGGYARSKVLAEALCRRAAGLGADVTVVRPFTVVGEGQRADMALHRWLRAAVAGEPLTVLGSLERTRDLTDVRDVAGLLVDLLELAPGGVVNLGSGVPVTLRRLVGAVGEATGTDPLVRVLAAGPHEVADTLADTARLVALTGRRPVTDVDDVVARVRDDLAGRGAGLLQAAG
jgi:nucleoside-diphosphate-sugar epimerase